MICDLPTDPRFRDLTGSEEFGRWVVLAYLGKRNDKRGAHLWLCRCECGVEKEVLGNALKSGFSTSCGCLRTELLRERSTTHGETCGGKGSTEYVIWRRMLQRCFDSNDAAYDRYGERGITVCDRWLSFENFLEDMGRRPKGLSLDRVDNNKGYYKDNCAWRTAKEQGRNQRSNVLLTLNGRTQCQSAWAEEAGIAVSTLRRRMQHGLTLERSLTLPLKGSSSAETRDHKEQIRIATRKALKRGELTRPAHCEDCGKPCKPQAHHNEYTEDSVLAVEWLCGTCHGKRSRLALQVA